MYKADFSYKTDEELNQMLTRCTGNSTRQVDKIVQNFFTQPVGTAVMICDHYPSRQADEYLYRRVAERLEREHHVKWHRASSRNQLCIVRDEPTMQELVKEEIKKRTGIVPEVKMNTIERYKLRYH